MNDTRSTPTAGGGAAPWGPALLLVAVAWAFVPQAHVPDFDSFKTLVLLVGVALLTAASAARSGALPSRDRDLLLVVPWTLALVALGVTIAAGPRGSLEGPLLAIGALGAARLVAAVPDGRAAVLCVARGASVAALGAGLYALVQVAGLDPAPWGGRALPVATFGNTSFAAEFQAAALPLALWLALLSGRPAKERTLGAAAALAAGVHLVLATSRIDLVAAAAALTVLGYRMLAVRGHARASRTLALASGAAGLGAAWLFLRAAGGAGPEWLGRGDTVAVRAHVWSAFREMVGAVPLLLPQGTPFVDLYPAFRHVDEFRLSIGRDVTSPHNDLMALTVVLGVAGALVAVVCASRLWRRLATADGAAGDARAAVAASLAALLVSGLASSPLSHGATALLAGCAWGAALALCPAPRGALAEPRIAHAAAALGIALAVLPALRTFRSDAFLAQGRQALADGRADEVLRAMDIAAAADGRAHEPRYELGIVLLNAGERAPAAAALRAAHEIRPGSPATCAGLARALLASGKRQEGGALLDEAIARFPWHPDLLSARAQLALAEGRGKEALADLLAARELLAHEPRMDVLVAEARLAAEPGFASHEQALDVLKELLAAGDRAQVARSVPAMIGRDPLFVASVVATARRLVRTEPEHAAVLIAAAVESPVARNDIGFLQEAGAVLTRAGWTDAGSRFAGRALGLEARAALARGENESALRLAEKAAPRDPDPEHWLVMARALARLDQRSAAIDAVGSAIATGRVEPDAVRTDPDLRGLLPDERLELLLQRAGERFGERP